MKKKKLQMMKLSKVWLGIKKLGKAIIIGLEIILIAAAVLVDYSKGSKFMDFIWVVLSLTLLLVVSWIYFYKYETLEKLMNTRKRNKFDY
ncbi:hypothetical protein PT285_07220 [Lactobacillus sp. ESL0791]|uniref:hypothetical protein n=1 Tax=Lactobacillus sp. ESL0791 TaxID=2983234 RepID=UPI0023F6FAC4|nr:hypothetical protein [Lactobacillus sp. ESL0791]MDF7639190.1 hypothetical protein [Lactobacillus sp. ESL0791]